MRAIGRVAAFLVVTIAAAHADGLSDARLDRLDRSFEVHRDLSFVETDDVDYSLNSPRGVRDHDRGTKSFTPGTETLQVLEAWVDEPDGTRVTVGPEGRFTRPSEASQSAPGFSAAMTTTILFPQLHPGSRTHVRWKLTQTSPHLFGFSSWNQPPLETGVGEAHITIRVPPDVPLKWWTRDFHVTDAVADGTRVIEASIANTQPEQPERDMVAPGDFQPLFLATTLPSPETLGADYWEVSLTKAEVTPEIAALAQRLAGGKTGEAAIRAVYDWVAANIRYVAVYLDPNSSWVPHPAAAVLHAGYGDCKDHVVLMQALLGALGIRAQAALIDWGERMQDPPLWLPHAFNHAIVYLPDYDRFLNPTNPFARFDSLDPGLADKAVVIASPEGRLTRTPPARPEDNGYAMDQTLTVDQEGQVTGTATYRMSPNLESGVRSMMVRASSTEDLAERFLAGTPEGGFGDFRTSSPHDISKPFDVVASWTSPHAVAFEDDVAYFPLPVGLDLDPAARLRRYLSPGHQRRHGVEVGAAEDRWTTTLRLPQGMSMSRVPEDINVQNGAGSYTATYRLVPDGLKAERRLVVAHEITQPKDQGELETLLYASINDARASVAVTRNQQTAFGETGVRYSP